MSRLKALALLVLLLVVGSGCQSISLQASSGLSSQGVGMAGVSPTTTVSTTPPPATPTLPATATASPTPSPTATQTLVPTATASPTQTLTPTLTAAAMPTATPDPSQQVNGIPVSDFVWMSPQTQANVRSIFERGQRLGRNPHAFSKMGDSLSLIAYYLVWFDQNRYELGPYEDLQPTIDFYDGSFQRFGVAARNGLHAWAAFHEGEADPLACLPEEHMLECEFRQNNPSVLLIRLGTNDNGTDDSFERAIRYTIEYAMDEGVIPVLSTKADRFEGEDNRNNITLRKLAAEYDIPLWDFDLLAGTLPGRGLGQDNVHLSAAPLNDYADPATFDYGYPVNDLAALMTLDAVRRAIIEEPLP